ncbi:oligomeric Golgi complex subunit 7 [Chytriomyces sp. MP71]|nr:oligomeric Golgi complex subunit 7 [Chytriomyces sp. MP71]
MPTPATTTTTITSARTGVSTADAKRWVNARVLSGLSSGALSSGSGVALPNSQPEPSSVSQIVDRLVTSSLLNCAELASVLDKSGFDAATQLPRLAHDLFVVQRHVNQLNDSLQQLAKETGHRNSAFDSLLLLDTIRQRMMLAREALQEAENWSSLTSELESIFEKKEFTKAGLRLAEASRSLVLLQGTPDYEDKRTLLFSLQTQLESAIAAPLLDALTSHDIPRIHEFHVVFDQINRSHEFAAHYYKAVKGPVLMKWKEIHDLAAGASATVSRMETDSAVFLAGLKQFLGFFLQTLVAELGWVS